MHVMKNAEFPTLPRFGVRMILREDMRNVNYIGMGPYESYADKHHASWHGSFLHPLTRCTRTISCHRKMEATLTVALFRSVPLEQATSLTGIAPTK